MPVTSAMARKEARGWRVRIWRIWRSTSSSGITSTRIERNCCRDPAQSRLIVDENCSLMQHGLRWPGKGRLGSGGNLMDKKWWTLLAVCTGTFMLLLDVTIVIVAQPAIQGGLHASFSDVQWVLD